MVDISQNVNTDKDWQLSDDGDLVLTADAELIGTNPILQDISQRINLFLGEWFLDNTIGVPWLQQIFIKNPDPSKIDAIFMELILSTPGVDALIDYSFTPNFPERSFSITFEAQTTMGTIDYSGTFSQGDGP